MCREGHDSDTHSRRNDIRNVIVLSVSFFFVFAAFFAIQNLQSTLNREDGIGVVSLACLYACFIVSGFLAPFCIRVFGAKWTIVIGSGVHTLYTASNLYPTWPILIISSILLGSVSGPMWTAQATYSAHRATNYARITSESFQIVQSRFNGLFFAILLSSQIVGNLISSLVLFSTPHTNDVVTNANHSSFNYTLQKKYLFCGSNDCPGINNATNAPSSDVVNMLFGIFCALDIAGLLTAAIFLQNIPKTTNVASVMSTFTSCFLLNVQEIKMVLLIPFFVGPTMFAAFMYAYFSKSYVSCALGIGMVGYVMSANGVANIVFSLVLGPLAKYTGRVFQILLVGVVYTGTLVALYLWTPTSDDIYALIAVSALWGIGEPVMLTQGLGLLADMFSENQAGAFANFHSWRAVGFSVAFALGNFFCVSTQIIIVGCVIVSAFFLYAIVEVYIWKNKQRIRALESQPGENTE